VIFVGGQHTLILQQDPGYEKGNGGSDESSWIARLPSPGGARYWIGWPVTYGRNSTI
jgi:hypothetical protein